jgi:NAD dependent epimerase/dehydratase family enzyme
VGGIVHALGAPDLRGPVNLTAPNPVTNAQFTRALGAALHRPTVVPAPTFALRAVLGREMADEMILGGQRVLPRALESSGYAFAHSRIEDALAATLST